MNVEMKDLLPNKVCASPIMDFEQLCNNGMRIEDTIHSGRIERMKEGCLRLRRRFSKVLAKLLLIPEPKLIVKALLGYFDPLGSPMSEVFDHMCKKGHLKPLDPAPPPNPLPKHWVYCHFHQRSSHNTDDCS